MNNVKDIFLSGKSIEEIRTILELPKDGRDWKIPLAINDLLENNPNIEDIYYRPFDKRITFYTGKSKGFLAYPRDKVLKHFIAKDNIGLLLPRQAITEKFGYFVTDKICDINYTGSAGQFGAGLVFPLYTYPDSEKNMFGETIRIPNLNSEVVDDIAKKIDLNFTYEKEESKNTFAPIDILDYIYAVLHSLSYREKYIEFLKIDFPRVPYPKDVKTFWDLVKLGKELREIHLLESNKVEDYITSYEMVENAENDHNIINTKIGKKDWEIIDTDKKLGRIWINESKYFDNVPVTAWEFYIGGYQPAQKWLKDRKERELKFEDILHYQKIIVALTETDRIMKEIDKIEIE